MRQWTVQKPSQCSLYNRSHINIFNLLFNSVAEVIFLSDNSKLFHKQAALNLSSRLRNVMLDSYDYKSLFRIIVSLQMNNPSHLLFLKII